ncbi:MAG: [FeFe] hydrogenase H-cluster maturation GTPase HydF, partial [Oscillospiraceae bacterium]
ITDSQVFNVIYKKTPKESKLTSFSILLAGSKGDLNEFISAANAIDNLTPTSHILIAEACTHAPLSEDIGRVKIPMMLKKKYGETLDVTIVSGIDFPKDLSKYDLIIHCGGCMFNKKYLMSRINAAKSANVPITNYGVLIAKINGILDKITY